jgi:ABC-2 type transport system permease protein
MFAIFRKELNAFFSSFIGYIAVGVFLLVMGVFLWVIPGFSILDYGYASLELYFEFAPIVLLVLIPAITMRSFAEENKEGTMELLVTKPLRDGDILMGKFLAALALVFFALLPTLLYYYSVWQLGAPKGNIDHGATLGSYIGLFFLSSAFVALGMFASSLSNDQIVAFIVGLLLNFVFYLGFYYISTLPAFFGKLDDFVQRLGFRFHYDAMSRGAIDSRDVIYFLTVIVLFLQASRLNLEKRKW